MTSTFGVSTKILSLLMGLVYVLGILQHPFEPDLTHIGTFECHGESGGCSDSRPRG